MVVVRSPAITAAASHILSLFKIALIKEVFPEPIEPMMSMASIFNPSNLLLFSLARLLFLAKRSFSNSISNISDPLDFIIFIFLTPIASVSIRSKNNNEILPEKKEIFKLGLFFLDKKKFCVIFHDALILTLFYST
jgi:hypothetical protein